MLPGLRSRWVMPWAWAASRAEATWRARATAAPGPDRGVQVAHRLQQGRQVLRQVGVLPLPGGGVERLAGAQLREGLVEQIDQAGVAFGGGGVHESLPARMKAEG